MAYTIEAAIQSKMFDEVMVSTDSEEYADIAKKYGAKVPFMRSSELSNDTASSWDLVRDVLHKYKKDGKEFVQMMADKGIGLRSWAFNDQQWCRVSIGTMEEMKMFLAAMKEV